MELSKFNKQEHKLETFEDEWLYFFKSTEDAQEAPSTLKDVCVKEAYRAMEMANWTDLSYDAYIRASLLLWEEEPAIEKAKAEGEAIGEARGRLRKRRCLLENFSLARCPWMKLLTWLAYLGKRFRAYKES